MEEKKQENSQETVGSKIKIWRKKSDLTQDTLARKSNIPYTTLAKIESNVIKNPSLQTITKIAKGLEITLDELIGDL
jgi:XRE family transcriptional regulator of biofilm formation